MASASTPLLGLAGHDDVGGLGQQVLEPGPQDGVVVGNQYSDHVVFPSDGAASRRCGCPAGLAVDFQVPPSMATRSRMPSRPKSSCPVGDIESRDRCPVTPRRMPSSDLDRSAPTLRWRRRGGRRWSGLPERCGIPPSPDRSSQIELFAVHGQRDRECRCAG